MSKSITEAYLQVIHENKNSKNDDTVTLPNGDKAKRVDNKKQAMTN